MSGQPVRSKLWYAKYPGAIYAEGPHRFAEEVTRLQFRAYLRDRANGRRLPHGTETWPTTEKDIEIVGNSNRPPGG